MLNKISFNQLKLIIIQSFHLIFLIGFGQIFLGLVVVLFAIYTYKSLREKILYIVIIFGVTYFHYFLMLSLGVSYDSTSILIIIISGNIFLLGFLFGGLLINKDKDENKKLNKMKVLFQNNYSLIIAFVVTILGYWDYIGRGGNKREVLASVGYEYYAMLFVVVLSVVDIYYSDRNKFKLVGYFACFSWVLLVSGERDILVKWVIAVLLIYWLVKKELKKIHFLVISVSGFLFMIFSHYLKGFANWGGYEITSAGFDLIFDNDLSVSSRNFYYMLNAGTSSMISFDLLINDILRFLGAKDVSATTFFNSDIYSDVGSARGFSLFAQIYFSSGYVGLFSAGYILGWLTEKYSLRNFNSNLTNVIVSSSLLFAFIYGTRSDLANMLSIVFKQTLFLYLIIIIFLSFVCRLRIKKWSH